MAMKALGQTEYGGVEVLKEVEAPRPKLDDNRPHDILVRIKGAAVNPVDAKKRHNFGNTSAKIANPPLIIGWDATGIVEEVGKSATLFRVGDHVMFAGSIIRAGCYAQYCVVDERIVGPKPSNLSFEEAAALPLVFLTAWEGLEERFGLKEAPEGSKDKSMLIVNGAGGVGSIAIQFAKKVFGLKTVIATASRDETIAWCKKMGADHVINHRNNLEDELKKIGFQGVDYIFCCHEPRDYFSTFAKIINPLGHIASILLFEKPADIDTIFSKSASYHAVLMFTKSSLGFEMETQHVILEKVKKLAEEGKLINLITQSFPFSAEGLAKAHTIIESGAAIGKIALPFSSDW